MFDTRCPAPDRAEDTEPVFLSLLSVPSLPAITIVAIDDDPTSVDLVAATLEQTGVTIHCATGGREGLDLVAAKRPQIVISDLMMPGITGMHVLRETLALDAGVEVILLTAHYSTEAAVEAVQKGASDYINKPVDTRKLRERVDGIIAAIRKRLAAGRLDATLVQAHRFRGIVGRSPLMVDVFAQVERIAPHFRTALITGPTGSGKELVARALHDASPAAKGPFIVCNCAAIPENLVESELFGHLKGSFTGAIQDKPGLFEAAHGGTILLDEIGEMPPAAQAKLLRVIQHGEVKRVGAQAPRRVDVRIIAATHRDLRGMIGERAFREDLFFRIGMVEIAIPPLRDRREDCRC